MPLGSRPNQTGSNRAAVRAQQFFAALGDRHDDTGSSDYLARDIAAVDRVFPDRQPRTRGAPVRDHFGIKPGLFRDPLHEIEHQGICRLGHPLLPWSEERRRSDISAAVVPRAQTGLSCPGTSFPEGGMRRLLFLNGIKAFEAAARSGSFAGAGLELNVSAAAISRMVHLLEQRLGVALFERKANRLAMTPAGRAYQSGLTPIFDALASLTAQVTASSSVRALTVGVGPTFAMRWLIPRLLDFQQHEPDIDVRIATGGAAAPFADDWSCGIKLGGGEWPDLTAEPLFAA